MIKKLLTYTLVVSTAVWSVGFLATPLAVGAAVSGDLIKLQCSTGADVSDPCRAVYYLGADSKRYVFPNEKTYKTWYTDFSGVQVVSQTEMQSYSIGGNVTYRPGVKMVKITTDPKVYAVASNGSLRWVTSEPVASALYGANWNQMIEDVPDPFFVNYSVGADVTEASQYDKEAEMEDSSSINADKNLSTDGGDGISTGTNLTVALAPDTPASGLLLGNSINNKFTKVNLTASADGDIVVDQLVVRRAGLASDAAFSSLSLIDGDTDKRIGNTKTINSEHQGIFNEDFTVKAGTTKAIYLAGNMGSLASYAGEVPALELVSMTLTGNASVVGSLPIVGNHQTLNGTITIGTLTVANGAENPEAQTQKIGTTRYSVSGIKLTANGTEDFHINQITFDQGGTASDADVTNLELLIDNVSKGIVEKPTDGKVHFDFKASPVVVAKGKSVEVELRLDIVDGSNRTIRFDLEDESDVRAVGQLYGAEVKVSAGTGATADAEPFWTGPVTTIDKGALRVGPATFSAANVPEDADQLELGKFEFEAKGEGIDITALPIAFTVTTSTGNLATDSTVDITNVTVYDENGKVLAGPIDPTSKHNTSNTAELLVATSTDTINLSSGLHIYTVKADVDSDFGSNDTIVVRINPGQITAKGITTGLSVTPTPSTDQSSATMTVKSAALAVSVSTSPVAQTVVAGTKQFTFANVILGAQDSGEDIKVTTIKVQVDCVATCSPSQVSNWSLYDGTTELAVTNDPDSQTSTKTTAADDATSTFTLSTPLVITKGTSKTLAVKGDISTAANSGTIRVGYEDATSSGVTAKGDNTNLDASLTVSPSTGQTMTLSSAGTITITKHADTPDAGFIPSGSSGLTVATLVASAQQEAVNIEKLYITASQVNSGGFDQIDTLYLYNENTLVAQVTPTATDAASRTALIDITNTPIQVPKDGTVKLVFKVDTPSLNYELNGGGIGAGDGGAVTAGTGTSGVAAALEGFQIAINAAGDVTAKGAQSGTSITADVTGANGNNIYLARSIPTVQLTETGGSIPAGISTKDLHSFTVTADSAGDIGLFAVSYKVATTTASLNLLNTFLYQGGTKVATASLTSSIAVGGGGSGNQVLLSFILTTNGSLADVNDLLPTDGIIAAGSSKTFTLRSDIECNTVNCNKGGGNATGGSIVVNFLGDTAFSTTTQPFTAKSWIGTTVGNVYDSSMVWTDWWRTHILKNSSTTATTTEQFYNAYLIKNDLGNDLDATSTGANWSK